MSATRFASVNGLRFITFKDSRAHSTFFINAVYFCQLLFSLQDYCISLPLHSLSNTRLCQSLPERCRGLTPFFSPLLSPQRDDGRLLWCWYELVLVFILISAGLSRFRFARGPVAPSKKSTTETSRGRCHTRREESEEKRSLWLHHLTFLFLSFSPFSVAVFVRYFQY